MLLDIKSSVIKTYQISTSKLSCQLMLAVYINGAIFTYEAIHTAVAGNSLSVALNIHMYAAPC